MDTTQSQKLIWTLQLLDIFSADSQGLICSLHSTDIFRSGEFFLLLLFSIFRDLVDGQSYGNALLVDIDPYIL